MSHIHQLYRLQQVDTELNNAKKRLVEILNAQKEPAEIQQTRARLEAATAEATKWRTQQKDQDLELGTLQNKIKQSEDRLYSGNIRTTQEMADLEKAIRSMKKYRDTLEENLLETMMELETADEEQTSTQKTYDTLTQNWAEKTAALKQEQHQVALRVNELMESRQKQAATIPAKLLTDYDNIRKRRTTGVALMKNDSCQGCQVSLSATIARNVNTGQLTHCPSCGRILVPM